MKATNEKFLRDIPEDRLICYCSKVTKETIRTAIQNGSTSVEMLQKTTKAGIGNRCKELNPIGKCCHSDLKTLIEIYGKKLTDNNSSGCSCCCS